MTKLLFLEYVLVRDNYYHGEITCLLIRVLHTGIHIADASVFIVVASILATFTIEKKVEDGVPIIPVARQTSAMIRSDYIQHSRMLEMKH